MEEVPIRDACSAIIVRNDGNFPRILMGQRGKSAVFMPNKYVFPGGAIDPEDALVNLTDHPNPICLERLKKHSPSQLPLTFLTSVIREIWEETGLIFGKKNKTICSYHVPETWQDFYKTGYAPSASGFKFMFRAITPPGRPRRFDARFFLVNSDHIKGDLDNFSRASDELSHLYWVSFKEAKILDLPFITEIILAEAEMLVENDAFPESVPFFNYKTEESHILRIK